MASAVLLVAACRDLTAPLPAVLRPQAAAHDPIPPQAYPLTVVSVSPRSWSGWFFANQLGFGNADTIRNRLTREPTGMGPAFLPLMELGADPVSPDSGSAELAQSDTIGAARGLMKGPTVIDGRAMTTAWSVSVDAHPANSNADITGFTLLLEVKRRWSNADQYSFETFDHQT